MRARVSGNIMLPEIMGRDLTKAVARAVKGAQCSLRTLARAASVPASTLSRIAGGEREATADVADRVGEALERMAQQAREQGGRCAKLARGIRQARRKHPKRGRTR